MSFGNFFGGAFHFQSSFPVAASRQTKSAVPLLHRAHENLPLGDRRGGVNGVGDPDPPPDVPSSSQVNRAVGLFSPGTKESGSPFSGETMFFASDPAHWGQSPARKESAVQARRTTQANTVAARHMRRRYQPCPKAATHFAPWEAARQKGQPQKWSVFRSRLVALE